MMPEVYATARRPLARIAEPFASRARARRHERFFALAGLPPDGRVLDVGCGSLGLRALEPELDITGLDLTERPEYPGPFVLADPAEGLPFADDEFDLVYCSSVIEHVPPARRGAFARSCAAWAGAGTCRRRPTRSRSSPTRCCRGPSGCPCGCAGATGAWAWPAAGRRSRCCAAASSRSCSAPPARSASRGW